MDCIPSHLPARNIKPYLDPSSPKTNNAYRLVETFKVDNQEANDSILARQRLNRPVSPHLSIYKPQITWVPSGLNRVTGCILSGAFYIFGSAYLVAPLLGWHIESASMAAAFAAWPVALKFATKLFFALPFTFHSFNGLRHLTWDFAKQITNAQVARTGWTVVGLSTLR